MKETIEFDSDSDSETEAIKEMKLRVKLLKIDIKRKMGRNLDKSLIAVLEKIEGRSTLAKSASR